MARTYQGLIFSVPVENTTEVSTESGYGQQITGPCTDDEKGGIPLFYGAGFSIAERFGIPGADNGESGRAWIFRCLQVAYDHPYDSHTPGREEDACEPREKDPAIALNHLCPVVHSDP